MHHLQEVLRETGWAFTTVSEDLRDFLDFAQTFGEVVHQESRPPVMPLRATTIGLAAQNTASAKYGVGFFPYHTDLAHWPLPPRYIVMTNARTASSVRTLLLDGKAIEQDGTVWKNARRGAWIAKGTARPFTCSMFFQHGASTGIRWDPSLMTPANRSAELTDETLRAHLRDTSNSIPFSWRRAGTALVVDNWRMLHARPSVPRMEEQRTLFRVFLQEI